MVRFVNGKPDKKLSSFQHQNGWRTKRFCLHEKLSIAGISRLVRRSNPIPGLILIDGSKDSFSSACEALRELNLYGKIPIAGIAKKRGDLLYRVRFRWWSTSAHPVWNFCNLSAMKRIGFAITFHRQKSKTFLKTEIEELKGVGKATTEKLLYHFKSVKK